MHIELVELLRCPAAHEDTWLVAALSRFEGRDVVEGTLGCPVCQRQFPVRDGAVDFTDPSPLDGRHDSAATGEGPPGTPRHEVPTPAHAPAPTDAATQSHAPAATDAAESADIIMRARALLALDEGGGTILVGGAHARHADGLADAVPVMVLLLNPPPRAGDAGPPPSAIRAAGGLPLAAGALRGAWLDAATATSSVVGGVVRALRPGARLVAPAGVEVPGGIRELARDAREWVGERDAGTPAASAPVPLRRR